MEKIINVHFPDLKPTLLKEAMEIFFQVREVRGLKKKPSTSELIDWRRRNFQFASLWKQEAR